MKKPSMRNADKCISEYVVNFETEFMARDPSMGREQWVEGFFQIWKKKNICWTSNLDSELLVEPWSLS